jgi:hypothetical protein
VDTNAVAIRIKDHRHPADRRRQRLDSEFHSVTSQVRDRGIVIPPKYFARDATGHDEVPPTERSSEYCGVANVRRLCSDVRHGRGHKRIRTIRGKAREGRVCKGRVTLRDAEASRPPLPTRTARGPLAYFGF